MSASYETPEWLKAQIAALKEQVTVAELRASDARMEAWRLRQALEQHAETGLCGARFRGLPCDRLVCVSKPHGPEEMHLDATGVRW